METPKEGIIIPKETRKEDQARRTKEFQKKYKALVEEYQIDFTATVVPRIQLIDLKQQK